MNNPVFQRTDFVLCNVPVPKGYPQSQTHSGVFYVNGRYFLTTSPYPAIKINPWVARFKHILRIITLNKIGVSIRAEAYENPFLYIGDEGDEPPTSFKLMQEKPLMDTPEDYYGLPAFNSDPDLFVEDERFYILNRSVYRTKVYEQPGLFDSKTRIYMIEGLNDGGRFKFLRNSLIREWDEPYASPCVVRYKNKFLFFYLDTNSGNDGMTFNGLYYSSSESIEDLKTAREINKVIIEGADVLPWHMSVFNYKDTLHTVIACVEKGEPHKIWQMFGSFSNDLRSLYIYHRPLTDYNSYRGASCVNDRGCFVLYTTTVHEKIAGSSAVDGRNVILAQRPFEKLLQELMSK